MKKKGRKNVKGDMRRHIASVQEGKRPNKCSICGKEFSQKGGMNCHIASVHEGKQQHRCPLCDKEFSQCQCS